MHGRMSAFRKEPNFLDYRKRALRVLVRGKISISYKKISSTLSHLLVSAQIYYDFHGKNKKLQLLHQSERKILPGGKQP